uniref:SJCHGC03074 protein n=1 Tax=Schistosoma japonicum TaxID=6182 RepID=Q5D9Z7_SCHJA|nr:SJCHGC03074 protein [Schistosoma japonicum]
MELKSFTVSINSVSQMGNQFNNQLQVIITISQLINAYYCMWSIGCRSLFSHQLCPGISFLVLPKRYSLFSCLTPIIGSVCSLVFQVSFGPEDSKLVVVL